MAATPTAPTAVVGLPTATRTGLPGVGLVVAANACFALSNLTLAAVPSVGALLVWRAVVGTGLSAAARPTIGPDEIRVGLIHLCHTVLFAVAVRTAAAFLAPAALTAGALGLWLLQPSGRSRLTGLAAAVAATAAVTFGVLDTPQLAFPPIGVVAAAGAATVFAWRLRTVGRLPDLDGDGAMVVQQVGQIVLGAAYVLAVGAQWTVPWWALLGALVGSWGGHRLVYAAGKVASPTVIAAGQPLAAAATAAGAALWLAQTFTVPSAAALLIGLAAAATVAVGRHGDQPDGPSAVQRSRSGSSMPHAGENPQVSP